MARDDIPESEQLPARGCIVHYILQIWRSERVPTARQFGDSSQNRGKEVKLGFGVELAELTRGITTGLLCPTRECSGWERMDGGGGGLCFPRGWARSVRIEDLASHQELQTHRDHVYAHETYLQAHQAQLQLQSTLIQTQHQVHETRFQMQHTELAALRETDRLICLALRVGHRGRARQPGPEARIPGHQEASGDADSHI
ncbi:hypothetical protein Tco_0228026 [Tanacetum coccineum]